MKSLLAFLVLATTAWAQSPAADFEPSLVHPLVISPGGNRLFVLNSPASRLLVFDISVPGRTILQMEIPVGLGPTSLAALSDDEVWVVDSLSDSISVVSVASGELQAVIPTGDDPADVVLAGSPLRAFVSCAGEDRIQVFDVATRVEVASIATDMKEPRALAVDVPRGRVWALSFRSGNRTTLVPALLAPAPPAPIGPNLPPAPQQALIISLDDPQWAAHPVNMQDIDAIAIDSTSLAPVVQARGIGTINFDLAVDPVTGALITVGFDSRNVEAFEPVLKSRFIRNQISLVHPLGLGVAKIDLDAGLATTNLPDTSSRQKSLAEPTAVALDLGRRRIWIAAQGSDRLAEFSDQGDLLRRIDLSDEALLGARGLKRGPRGLVLNATATLAYVYERLAHRVAVVDLNQETVIEEISLGIDPITPELRRGRGFFYDALLSGNGSVSCAACHVDGEYDLLAWDLGDPSGSLHPVPAQPRHPAFPPNSFPAFDFHPMKGPMVTQTLRGLATNKPYHWRGDKADIEDFNGAFASLLGGNELAAEEMKSCADWIRSLQHQPNPHQNLDRSFSAAAQAGKTAFENAPALSFSGGFQLSCADCHSQPDGSGVVTVLPTALTFIGPSQPTNTPQLRGLYRRGSVPLNGTNSKVGFGFSHDGGLPDLRFFLDIPAFNLTQTAQKDDIAAYLLSFDSGVAPALGRRLQLDLNSAASPQLAAELQTLEASAAAGDVDLVAWGRLDGRFEAFSFDVSSSNYIQASTARPRSPANLFNLATQGRIRLIFMAVMPGEGSHFSSDMDRDGLADRSTSGQSRGPAGTGPLGPLSLLRLPSADRWSTEELRLTNLPPGAQALLILSRAPDDRVLSGQRILVDFRKIVGVKLFISDGAGIGRISLPRPFSKLHAQALIFLPGPPVQRLTSNALIL